MKSELVATVDERTSSELVVGLTIVSVWDVDADEVVAVDVLREDPNKCGGKGRGGRVLWVALVVV